MYRVRFQILNDDESAVLESLYLLKGVKKMASLNKCHLIGNLGKDPEFKVTPSGRPVANFSIATTDKWKDKDGQKKERTEWHNIVMWGKLAELANQYLKKGRPVYIEGSIQTRSWEKDGQKHYKTEIVATGMQFLGSGSGQQSADAGSAQGSQATETNVSDDLPF